MVSWRFNNTRATSVQAASSAGSTSGGCGCITLAEQGAGRGRLLLILIVMLAQEVQEDRNLPRPGRARQRQAETALQASSVVRTCFVDDAGGKDPGRLDVRGVVQEDEGLERRV